MTCLAGARAGNPSLRREVVDLSGDVQTSLPPSKRTTSCDPWSWTDRTFASAFRRSSPPALSRRPHTSRPTSRRRFQSARRFHSLHCHLLRRPYRPAHLDAARADHPQSRRCAPQPGSAHCSCKTSPPIASTANWRRQLVGESTAPKTTTAKVATAPPIPHCTASYARSRTHRRQPIPSHAPLTRARGEHDRHRPSPAPIAKRNPLAAVSFSVLKRPATTETQKSSDPLLTAPPSQPGALLPSATTPNPVPATTQWHEPLNCPKKGPRRLPRPPLDTKNICTKQFNVVCGRPNGPHRRRIAIRVPRLGRPRHLPSSRAATAL